MNFHELFTALKSNEVEITDAILSAFGLQDAEDLRFWATEYRSAAARYVLDRSGFIAIAENLEWAAERIEQLKARAA